jgi:hypothetical protein
MDINEMIEKWEKKHSSLLDEYTKTQKMMTEREICECRNHMKNVLEFTEDLKQVKNCSKYSVINPCIHCGSKDVVIFTSDLNLCNECGCSFDA